MEIKTFFKLIFICLLILNGSENFAQFYSAGQDPASIRWKQINTENFQVIFPQGYEDQARYITRLLEWSYENVGKSLEHQPRKVSVIVHNQTIVSNGFVSWAPRRIELYTNAPSNNDFHDWMERLVIHEFRHVVQIDKLNQGLTRLLGILFGEMGTGAVVGHLPLWFLEGDAVATETAFTRAGRGRLPRFEQGLRAQILNYGTYSFDKAVFGSYKDHVPNYYELGYQLISTAREEHGAEAWSQIVNNVARRPWGLYPFSAEMRRQFGRGQIRHYNHTFRRLKNHWTEQMESHTYSPTEKISPENRLFTSYHYPQWVNDSTILALRTGLKDITTFVMIHSDGTEKELFHPGTVFPQSIHYRNGTLVWSEFRPDPRWEHRNYAEIMAWDMTSGIRERITDKGRYFSPALSPDRESIAAVKTTPEGKNSLVLVDRKTGEEKWYITLGDNDFIMQPTWHESGKRLAVIALDESGKRLEEILIENKTTETLLRAEDRDISSPVYSGEDILFNGTWSGIDNIYLYRRRNSMVEQVVSSAFGAVNASVNGQRNIVFSEYTAQGYQVSILKPDQFEQRPLELVEDNSKAFHTMLADQENTVVSPDVLPRDDYEIKRYSRLRNLFHLHSWVPASIDVDLLEAYPGFSLLFQNKLSTAFAQAGYEWDYNDQTGRILGSFSYHGLYPVIGLTAETGDRRFYYSVRTQDTITFHNFVYREDAIRLAVSVPLRFQQGGYFYGITPWIRAGIIDVQESRHTPDSIFAGNDYRSFVPTRFFTQDYRFLMYWQRRTLARDIFPREGIIIDFNYRHTPWEGNDMGSVTAFRGILYLPGVIRHHGIRLSAGIQQRKRGVNETAEGTFPIIYSFGNIISYPRGVTGQSHRTLSSFNIDYAFPILYPDISLPYLLYLKRIRGYVFHDFARAVDFPDSQTDNRVFSSSGFGLSGDMHLLGLYAPIQLGVQVAFPKERDPNFQLIFSVNF